MENIVGYIYAVVFSIIAIIAIYKTIAIVYIDIKDWIKKLLVVLFFLLSIIQPTVAGTGLFDDIDRQVEMQQGYYPPPPPPLVGIDYGYNAYGNYVPTSVGNQRIQYGYNAVGDYVPMSVGEQRIHYGYNAYGDFVPMSIGD